MEATVNQMALLKSVSMDSGPIYVPGVGMKLIACNFADNFWEGRMLVSIII